MEDYLITITFSNKGEEGAIPINAENLNKLIASINVSLQKVAHITADANSTSFEGRVYANNKEIVTTNKTESEDI